MNVKKIVRRVNFYLQIFLALGAGVFFFLLLIAIIAPGVFTYQRPTDDPPDLKQYLGYNLENGRLKEGEITLPRGNLVKIEQFADYQNCRQCHSTIYQQLQASLHGRSADDLVYETVEALAIEDNGREFTRFCATCHVPMGLLGGEISSSIIEGDISKAGTQCTLCHNVTSLHNKTPGNGSFVVDPAHPRHPLFWESEPPFKNVSNALLHLQKKIHTENFYPKLLKDPKFCGACHNEFAIKNDRSLKLQKTFEEWAESPYGQKGGAEFKTCQDCHMSTGYVRFEPTPGKNAPLGKNKTHVATHFFQGANTSLHATYNNLEHLFHNILSMKGAARIESFLNGGSPSAPPLKIRVRTHNIGAGHNLPTGATDLRAMWLEVVLLDGTGNLLFSSGVQREDGYLPVGTQKFKKILVDGLGEEISDHRTWRVRKVVSDTTIKPLSFRDNHFEISPFADFSPASITFPLRLTVRLLYQAFDKDFLRATKISNLNQPLVEMGRTMALIEKSGRFTTCPTPSEFTDLQKANQEGDLDRSSIQSIGPNPLASATSSLATTGNHILELCGTRLVGRQTVRLGTETLALPIDGIWSTPRQGMFLSSGGYSTLGFLKQGWFFPFSPEKRGRVGKIDRIVPFKNQLLALSSGTLHLIQPEGFSKFMTSLQKIEDIAVNNEFLITLSCDRIGLNNGATFTEFRAENLFNVVSTNQNTNKDRLRPPPIPSTLHLAGTYLYVGNVNRIYKFAIISGRDSIHLEPLAPLETQGGKILATWKNHLFLRQGNDLAKINEGVSSEVVFARLPPGTVINGVHLFQDQLLLATHEGLKTIDLNQVAGQ